MTKLFVGQVPAICSEDQLSAIFGQFGELTDISIMRDRATGRSKGSAWVVFKDPAAAEDAIQTLHDKHSIPPQSNSLQIRYAGKPAAVATPPNALAPQATTSPTMQPAQAPTNAPPAPAGINPPQMPPAAHQDTPQRFMYPTQEQQQQQQQQPYGQQMPPGVMPPMSVPGPIAAPQWDPTAMPQTVSPTHAMSSPPLQHAAPPGLGSDDETSPRRHQQRPDKKYPPCGGRKLFVGQLPKDMTREGVHSIMANLGPIEELHVMTDKRTGQGTGAAFVIFEKREDAVRAISELNGVVTIPGMKCPMQVRFAEGELDRTQDGKLFVGQVPYSANEEDLKRLFGPFGNLTEVALVRKGGQSKGCGFVRFTDRKNAEEAIVALNGRHTMVGGHSPLTVRFADSEEEKRKRREDRQAQQMHNMIAQMQPPTRQPMPQQPMHQPNPGQNLVPMMGIGMHQGLFQNALLPMYSPVMSQ